MEKNDMIKEGWLFFQNQILGMKWLHTLIGDMLEHMGVDPEKMPGGVLLLEFPIFRASSRRREAGELWEDFMESVRISWVRFWER